jgi:sugar phosphate isomerase/epimerase
MIFVSSSCLKHFSIKDSVIELAEAGFRNIELSGGTKIYPEFLADLLELKEKYSLNYRCHNYFPPSHKPFVLNLASLDDSIYRLSFEHVKKALDLSKLLGANKYGFHAGFLINIGLDEIGKSIKEKPLFDKKVAVKRFCESARALAVSGVQLYIENNVLNGRNYLNYNKVNPLLMTEHQEILSLMRDCHHKNFLLDIAHLKVTAKTLGLSLENELNVLIPNSDYIHISDNDGNEDSNEAFKKGSQLYEIMRSYDLRNKDFTIEVYSGLKDISDSYLAIEDLSR